MKSGIKISGDQNLLEQLRDSKTEEDGILYLYQHYFKTLSLFVVQNNGSEEDAEDIFQEVVVAFIQLVKQHKFRGESSVKTFLLTLNRNMWYNELKRRGRAAERAVAYEQQKENNESTIESAMENREAGKAIKTIIDQLDENCKKILLLFYYENYSMKDILSQVKYENEQVVRNKKSKCMKKLTQLITDEKELVLHLQNLFNG